MEVEAEPSIEHLIIVFFFKENIYREYQIDNS